ncbi:TPA: hypothetical protein DDW35_05245, partial [Candidatus Sumerlaeota bacterium]|nr:hypothetical protein [Candidatus Sumerlaeota bacterium]
MNAAAISTRRWNHLLLCVLLFASMLWIALPLGAEESANPELSPVMLRLKEMEAYKNHNFKEALDIYQQLLLDTKNTSQTTPTDLGRAIVCLAQLSRLKETDMLLEKTVEVHADNWKMLREAATIYKDKLLNHDGVLVEGKFERGSHRGQDKYANAVDRDRVRALQLYVQAMKAAEKTKATKDDGLSDLYKEMELALQMGRSGQNNSWELQTLSDLTTLPDYEEGYHYGRGGGTQGAPVNEKGNPVFYNVPQSFESAQNDGERWRWCLDKMVRLDAGRRNYANSRLADFLRQQFDVQTLAEYSWFKRAPSDDDKKDESGTYAMHTL